MEHDDRGTTYLERLVTFVKVGDLSKGAVVVIGELKSTTGLAVEDTVDTFGDGRWHCE